MPDEPIYRGDDATLRIVILDANGDPEPLEGKTLFFTAKKRLSDPDEVAVIAKMSGEGIELLEDPGEAIIEIDAADTANLASRQVKLEVDVQVLEGGKTRTLIRDVLYVDPDVTRRIS